MLDDRDDEYEELEDCKILAKTDAAIRVNYKGALHWIPKSVIEDPDDLDLFAEATLLVKRWFVVKNEI